MRKSCVVLLALVLISTLGCAPPNQSSDKKQKTANEKILQEATAQTGMPSIKNFRERKLLKDILELRDQEGLVTYTYLENLTPAVVHGRTALGGKLTYYGESIGYGIPYATQYTNPMQKEGYNANPLPQADPNGLFSPASAEGTWVLIKDPKSEKVLPTYLEPRIVVSPFKHPFD